MPFLPPRDNQSATAQDQLWDTTALRTPEQKLWLAVLEVRLEPGRDTRVQAFQPLILRDRVRHVYLTKGAPTSNQSLDGTHGACYSQW